jgi:hypothetical protein
MFNRQKIGIVLGVSAFILLKIMPLPDGMSPKARKLCGI